MKVLSSKREDFLSSRHMFGAFIVCHVGVVEQDDGSNLVLLSEVPDNPGASITNASEEIANQVLKTYNLDPNKTRWIEHYPFIERNEEMGTFDEVSYKINNYSRLENPQWKYMSKSEAEKLLPSSLLALDFAPPAITRKLH